jgi:transposase-like protein
LTKRIVERALRGELTLHLGYEQREKPRKEENYQNRYRKYNAAVHNKIGIKVLLNK